jgi:PAS domain S-box-containing protein
LKECSGRDKKAVGLNDVLSVHPGFLVACGPEGEVLFRGGTGGAPAELAEICTEVAKRGTGVRREFESRGRWYHCEAVPGPSFAVAVSYDVTESKRELEQLRRSETLMTDAQGIAHLGTWDWDVNEPTLRWSDELYRIFGVKRGEYVPTYEGYLAKVHPDDRERVRSVMEAVFHQCLSFSHDERVLRPDGSVRHLQTWGHPVPGPDGKLQRLIGVCLDITARKQLEADVEAKERERRDALEKSYAFLKSTLESTADGILVIDDRERITGYNGRFLELWQIPPNAIENQGYRWALQFVLDQLRDPGHCLERLAYLKRNPRVESLDVLHFHDGRIYERYSRPQILGDVVTGRVFSYRDVTARVRAEDALRNSENRLKLLSDFTEKLAGARLDLRQILDIAARFTAERYDAGCMIRLFDSSRTRLDTAAVYHVNPEIQEMLRRVVPAARDVIDAEGTKTVLETKRGLLVSLPLAEVRSRLKPEFWPHIDRYRFCKWIIVPLRVGGGISGTVTLFRSESAPAFIDEDRELLQEMADRSAAAIDNAVLYSESQRALSLREEFIMVASHELRTPLTPLKLQNQLLALMLQEGGFVASTPSAAELAKVIGESGVQVARLTRLVDDMLDAARIRTGRLSIAREPCELAELARAVCERVAPAGRITLRASTAVKGRWDRARLEQVLNNLLLNALKFGEGKAVEVSVAEDGNDAILTVADHGIGIRPEDHERIFERFERAAPVGSYGGIGMGLYIAREIVRAHGGSISVESAPGAGATFTVRLPLRDSGATKP